MSQPATPSETAAATGASKRLTTTVWALAIGGCIIAALKMAGDSFGTQPWKSKR